MRRALTCIGILAILSACGRPGPDNFEKYTANEAGVRKLKEYIQDASNPAEDRVAAMAMLIEDGWAMSTRSILDGCPDRAELAGRVTDGLIDRLPGLFGKPKRLAPVRDGIFIALSVIPEEKRRPRQERIAAWAFEGLGPDSTADQVKKTVEPRILVNQVTDLGPAGLDGALMMIRHGFGADKLARFVLSLEVPEANRKLVEAFQAMHAIPDIVIRLTHLEALGKTRRAEAVLHLLDITADEKQEPDVRAEAFNAAASILDRPDAIQGSLAAVSQRLRKLLVRKDPDDRWSATRYLMRMEGFGVLDEVMAALKDDGVYPRAYEDPIKTMVDLCSDVIFREGAGEASWDVVKRLLKSPNKVHQALGIICLKASGDPSRGSLVKGLTRSRKPLDDVLGESTRVGRLAVNALEGLALMKEVAGDQASGKLSESDARRKRFLVLVNLMDTGEAYREAVEQRFEKGRKAK